MVLHIALQSMLRTSFTMESGHRDLLFIQYIWYLEWFKHSKERKGARYNGDTMHFFFFFFSSFRCISTHVHALCSGNRSDKDSFSILITPAAAASIIRGHEQQIYTIRQHALKKCGSLLFLPPPFACPPLRQWVLLSRYYSEFNIINMMTTYDRRNMHHPVL